MNTKYGHLDNGILVYAQNSVTINGIVYLHPSAETYLRCTPPEKRINRGSPSEPAPEGYHYENQGYVDGEREISINWVVVANPPAPAPAPRVFSKLYLELALFKAGLLQQVDDFIDSQEITNERGDTMPLRRAYGTALTFSEDNEYFSQYMNALKTELELTDEQVEEILSHCIAD